MEPNLSGVGYDYCAFLDYESSNDIYLNEIGSCACTPSYSFGPSIRPRDIFHYVISGRGKLFLDTKEFEINANELFYIPAGVKSYYIADEDEPWEYIWWHLGGPRLPDILYKIGISKTSPVLRPTSNLNTPIDLFNDMKEHREQELYCLGKTFELFDYLIMNSELPKENLQSIEQLNYVKRTIKFIQLKYSCNIKVEQIAEVCGLNRSYLSRLFKDATGTSIQDYIIHYRMKIAKQLLQDSKNSIQLIAMAVGYTDIYTFSKAFKLKNGISPREYRKKYIE